MNPARLLVVIVLSSAALSAVSTNGAIAPARPAAVGTAPSEGAVVAARPSPGPAPRQGEEEPAHGEKQPADGEKQPADGEKQPVDDEGSSRETPPVVAPGDRGTSPEDESRSDSAPPRFVLLILILGASAAGIAAARALARRRRL